MAKSSNQKMKLLYLMKIFMEYTDEEHPLTTSEIISKLKGYDISAERKSLYDDIECLRTFGMDIISRRERPAGHYLGSREFELAELKLLVDTVQSSKFITTKKSTQLIKKLENLASRYEAQQLHRQVYVNNRPKTMNESIYYNVDKLHTAIAANSKIKFKYFEWTVTKEIKLKRGGESYKVSPWALIWDDENYYLIAYDDLSESIRHYRVDKMLDIEYIDEKRSGRELFADFDAAQYEKKMFGMFGGEEKNVTLLCKNGIINVIVDRFGRDVTVHKADEEHFTVHIKASISPQFFGWLTGLGTSAVISSPVSIRDEYAAYLKEILEVQKTDDDR